MKANTTPPSVLVATSTAAAAPGGFTLGLDLGDRRHHCCVLDAGGQIVRQASLVNTRPALTRLLAEFPGATVALEAGTHSPWISRFLIGCAGDVTPLAALGLRDVGEQPGGAGGQGQVAETMVAE